MTHLLFAAVLLLPLLPVPSARAAEASGNDAISLAARVGERSPLLPRREKSLLDAYLDGRKDALFPSGRMIAVKADEATCRILNPDVTAKECTLVFAGRTARFRGREAQALYATLIEAGVPSSGAAGSIYESVKALNCEISPSVVRQGSGGGATCQFTPNP